MYKPELISKTFFLSHLHPSHPASLECRILLEMHHHKMMHLSSTLLDRDQGLELIVTWHKEQNESGCMKASRQMQFIQRILKTKQESSVSNRFHASNPCSPCRRLLERCITRIFWKATLATSQKEIFNSFIADTTNCCNKLVKKKLCASCSFFSFPSAKSQRFHCWSESQDASLL